MATPIFDGQSFQFWNGTCFFLMVKIDFLTVDFPVFFQDLKCVGSSLPEGVAMRVLRHSAGALADLAATDGRALSSHGCVSRVGEQPQNSNFDVQKRGKYGKMMIEYGHYGLEGYGMLNTMVAMG